MFSFSTAEGAWSFFLIAIVSCVITSFILCFFACFKALNFPCDCGCFSQRSEFQYDKYVCCKRFKYNAPFSNYLYLGFNPQSTVNVGCFGFKKRLLFRNSVCTICLEDFFLNEDVVLFPCGHCYHKGCIENWLIVKNNCPLCKVTVGKTLNDSERTPLLQNV